jgi:hypothetical protein
VGPGGAIWSIECSARRQSLSRPATPFVHTNHYLTDLKELESEERIHGSRMRYRRAQAGACALMRPEALKKLCDDTSEGRKTSIFNRRTVARMVVDLAALTAQVWLRREAELGWVAYPLGFVARP